jgi:DNA-nicking Smr family endonuclease
MKHDEYELWQRVRSQAKQLKRDKEALRRIHRLAELVKSELEKLNASSDEDVEF